MLCTMRFVTTDDGVRLSWYEAGSGSPVLFVHEFGGDHRSWGPQVARFARRRRCLTYDARGYPPSATPADPDAYSQARAVADALAVLDAAGAERAHVVGNSMGGFCALHLALRHPGRVRSAVVAGCGYGAHPDVAAQARAGFLALADRYRTEGAAAVAADYGNSPARAPLREKDPDGHAEHLRILAAHDPLGAALTLRGVQAARPSLYGLRDELAAVRVPVLLVVGDRDDDALDATLMLHRTLPRSRLAVLPDSGHLTNLEEPALFNSLVEDFHADVTADGTVP